MLPFAPSFDTIGWFARDPNVLEKVGNIVLRRSDPTVPSRLLIASDAFEMVETAIRDAINPYVEQIRHKFTTSSELTVSVDGLKSWMECFRTIQGAEIWKSLGPWIIAENPDFGPGINERISIARKITQSQVASARKEQRLFVDRLKKIMNPGDVLCLPTSPRVAPLKGTDTNTIEDTYRYQAMCLLSIASLGGLPQITLPMATLNHLPLGISLMGLPYSDLQLLRLACNIEIN